MDREALIQYILNSSILNQWHWFAPHFTSLQEGQESPFVRSLLDSLLEIGEQLPALPLSYLHRIASFSGKSHNIRQYEQLMQILAEILILHRVTSYNWSQQLRFEWEPQSHSSNKGPELNIYGSDYTIGIEVKSPSLLFHENPNALKRNQQSKIPGSHPKFNPVENYLESAQEKFTGFKTEMNNYHSLLVVVWDHMIHEPVSALLNPDFGLFRQSKAYPMVDAIVLTQHRSLFRQFFKHANTNQNSATLLDYGTPKTEPYKLIIENPSKPNSIPVEIRDCFQALNPQDIQGDKYNPMNQIPWREFH